MRVQIVQHHSDHRYVWVGLVHQPAHLKGEVLHGTLPGDSHVAPASPGLAGEEQVAGSAPHVLVVLSPGASRGRWQGRTGIGQQLGGTLVEADHRPLGIVGLGVQVQDILHVGHEVGTHLGDAPLLLLPRLERVFFKCSRTVSWDKDSTRPSSTVFPARSRRVQWSWPWGAGLQARAIR